MTNLTYTKSESGLEVVILKSGQAFCTQSSYAVWTGCDRTTVVKRCGNLEIVEIADLALFSEGCELIHTLIKTTIQTDGGVQEVVLIPAKIMGRWLAKDRPELFDAMVDAGSTQFLYQVAGYKVAAVEEKPKTAIELFEYHLAIAKEHEIRLAALEAENAKLKELQADNERRLDGVEAEVERFNYPMGRYFTVMGYAAFLGKKVQLQAAASLGTKASKVCKGLNIQPEKVKDQRFGYVNSYPEQILEELFEAIAD